MRYDEFLPLLQKTPHAELVKIHKLTGIPFSTIRNIRSETTPNPGIRTVERICAYFQAQGK